MPKFPKRKVPGYMLDAIRGKGRGTPRLDELVQHFFDLVGGPRRVARLIYEEFCKAKEGSMMRQRTLTMIMHAMRQVNAAEIKVEDLSLLSDEDLSKVAEDLFGTLEAGADDQETENGGVEPGDQESPGPAAGESPEGPAADGGAAGPAAADPEADAGNP